jgi:regulatory factor X, other
LHSAQHLTNPHGFVIDPALSGPTNHGLPAYSTEGAVGDRHDMTPPPVDYSGFELDNQMLDAGFDDQDQDQDPGVGGTANGKPSRRGTTLDVANDIELRRLHKENRHRSLEDIGIQLRKDEGEPCSEKTRQIFAMSWYVKRSNYKVLYTRLIT